MNRINQRARRWLESGRRLAGWEVAYCSLQEEALAVLPDGLAYLNELRSLSDRVVNARLLAGNCLQLLENGENAYPAMLAAIRGSSHSVNLSTYIFDGDSTGRLFVAALTEAADRGVQVRVIIDSLGEKYSRPTVARLLKSSRVKVAHFLPLRQGGYVNLRNHRKLLVIDGTTGFTGGMNIGDRHLTNRSGLPPVVRDIHFMVTGHVVAELQRTFLEDWFFVTRELVSDLTFFPRLLPAGNAFIRAVSDGPDKEFRKLNWIILGAISCARHRILIMTPYFIPDRPLISSLVTAALRGVEITLVLPALNNLPFVQWASQAYLWELLQHGIRVYSQPPPVCSQQAPSR